MTSSVYIHRHPFLDDADISAAVANCSLHLRHRSCTISKLYFNFTYNVYLLTSAGSFGQIYATAISRAVTTDDPRVTSHPLQHGEHDVRASAQVRMASKMRRRRHDGAQHSARVRNGDPPTVTLSPSHPPSSYPCHHHHPFPYHHHVAPHSRKRRSAPSISARPCAITHTR